MSDTTQIDANVASQFKGELVAVAKSIIAAKSQQGESSKATGKVKDTVTAYATATAAAGVPGPTANATLRDFLIGCNVPKGTALNYGRAVEGFRKIAADGKLPNGKPIPKDGPTMGDAQKAMESADTAALNAARAELARYTKNANVKQLESLTEWAASIGIQPKAAGAKVITIPEGFEDADQSEGDGEGEQEGEKLAAAM